MANINLSESFGKAIYEGFGGIERQRTAEGGVGLVDLINVRVESNGTLTKRGGFESVLELPEGRVRAIHPASENLVFALIENELYELYPNDRSYTHKATLAESDSEACFFNYGNELYLNDGRELYVYSGSDFEVVEGYVPLYGKNWHPITRGEVYQPLNSLSSRLRVSYKISELSSTGSTTFILPQYGKSIDKVLRNGANISASDFSFGSLANMVTTTRSLTVGDEIEIFFTISSATPATYRSALLKHTGVATFGFASNSGDPSFIAFFGGEESSEICVSRRFEAQDMTNASKGYTKLRPLYFVKDDGVTINDGSSGITAAARSGSGLAVFTPSSAYVFSEGDGGRAKAVQISDTLGCTVKNGALTLENSPVTIFRESVLYWSLDDLNDNKYSAKTISDPISELWPYISRWHTVALHSRRGELWFCRDGGRVWIYNIQNKLWYSFEGFNPEKLFEMGNDMAFVSGSRLYVFSDNYFYDETDGDWQPICATVRSDMMSFGAPNRKKRLSRAMLSFSSGGNFTLTVENAESTPTDTEIVVTGEESRDYYETRLICKRSRHYSFTLTHEDGPFSLYAIILSAVK